MDFQPSEEQTALAELAGQILSERVTHERLTELERRGPDGWLDAELWRELGSAGLLGAALPETYGGGGLGFTEAAVVCEEVGRVVAHAPVWSSLVCAALPIASFGTDAQRERLLPGAIAGETVLTAALVETGNQDPRQPRTRATRSGDGWTLTGTKICVPLAATATAIVVTASTDDGDGLFLLDPAAPGVAIESGLSTALEPQAAVRLDDASVEILEGGRVDWLIDRALAGLAAQQTGICERALRMSADYTTEREQFGRPVATFQAVGHRLADAYTDTLALRLATAQAVWRIAEGLPAGDAAAVAKWWAAEAGHRVTHAAHHVHGGVGVDVTYPLHRYIRWATQIELTLGGAAAQLRIIGARLAAETTT
jgi:alkylation response protein AidB-like acyl-CoA dehydrogenase